MANSFASHSKQSEEVPAYLLPENQEAFERARSSLSKELSDKIREHLSAFGARAGFCSQEYKNKMHEINCMVLIGVITDEADIEKVCSEPTDAEKNLANLRQEFERFRTGYKNSLTPIHRQDVVDLADRLHALSFEFDTLGVYNKTIWTNYAILTEEVKGLLNSTVCI